MSERTSSKPGIADYVVARRKRKECFLDEIDRLIDWNPLEKLLRKTLKRVANAVGNPAYPPLPMLKIRKRKFRPFCRVPIVSGILAPSKEGRGWRRATGSVERQRRSWLTGGSRWPRGVKAG